MNYEREYWQLKERYDRMHKKYRAFKCMANKNIVPLQDENERLRAQVQQLVLLTDMMRENLNAPRDEVAALWTPDDTPDVRMLRKPVRVSQTLAVEMAERNRQRNEPPVELHP